jgi:hypothetical protein
MLQPRPQLPKVKPQVPVLLHKPIQAHNLLHSKLPMEPPLHNPQPNQVEVEPQMEPQDHQLLKPIPIQSLLPQAPMDLNQLLELDHHQLFPQTNLQTLELLALQPLLELLQVKSLTLVLDQDLALVLHQIKEVDHLVQQVPAQLLLKTQTYQPQLPLLVQPLQLQVDQMELA